MKYENMESRVAFLKKALVTTGVDWNENVLKNLTVVVFAYENAVDKDPGFVAWLTMKECEKMGLEFNLTLTMKAVFWLEIFEFALKGGK